MNHFKTWGLAAIGAVGLCSIAITPDAQAATLTSSTTVSTDSTSSPTSFNLNQFDPSQGVLNSITLDYSGFAFATLTVLNLTPTTQTGSASANLTIQQVSPGTTFSQNVSISDSVTVDAFDIGFADGLGLADLSTTLTNSSLFAPYIGSGTFQNSLALLINSTSATSPLEVIAPIAFTSGTASVTYDFTPATPIPTPALLPGLLGMGIAAWRKRKNEESEQVAETAEV